MKLFVKWIALIVALFAVQSNAAVIPPLPYLYKGPINDLIPLYADTQLRLSQADIVFDFSKNDIKTKPAYYDSGSVTATYEIENLTNEDRSIDLAMPYASPTEQNEDSEATVLQDGKPVSFEFCPGGFKCEEGYSDSVMQNIAAAWDQRETTTSNEIGTLTTFKVRPSADAIVNSELYTVHAWMDNPKTKLFSSAGCYLSNEQLGHLEVNVRMDQDPEFLCTGSQRNLYISARVSWTMAHSSAMQKQIKWICVHMSEPAS